MRRSQRWLRPYKMEADKLKSYMTDSDKDQMSRTLQFRQQLIC